MDSPRALVPAGEPHSILISEILSGLSHALDITEGHPRGHAARSCLIGMRLAQALGLTPQQQGDLFYALLLKDAGCSSNAARVHQLFGGNDHETKRAVWLRDWRRMHEQARYALQYVGRGESPYRKLLMLGRLAMGGRRVTQELFQIRCDRGAAIATGLGLSDATASAKDCAAGTLCGDSVAAISHVLSGPTTLESPDPRGGILRSNPLPS